MAQTRNTKKRRCIFLAS